MTSPSISVFRTAWRLWHATTPPPPFLSAQPFATYFSSRTPSQCLKSPKYVLSRGFASGVFAWSSLPSKASETTAAVVSSCSSNATIDRVGNGVNGRRKLREGVRAGILVPLARSVWKRGVCTDCRKDRILRMSRRSASSKSSSSPSSGKNNGMGRSGRGKDRSGKDRSGNGNGEKEYRDYSKGSTRPIQSQRHDRNIEKGGRSDVTPDVPKRLPLPLPSLPAPASSDPKPPSGDDKHNSSLAASAYHAIAKRAARDHGFMERLPLIHRPSKEELLAAASSAWDRLRIRFKWLTIRQIRPFNMDEISAFFSWIILGNLAWIILGTTTFFSIGIWLVNTVFAQEYLAKVVGNYLTQEMGMKVVFESAIVPRWKDGCISFKNVFVSRRPGILKGTSVQKGSSSVAAAAAAAAAFSEDHSGHPYEEDDGNYTQFDVTINTVNVTISLAKWMNGRGLLVDVDMKGVRGIIDRTHLQFDEDVDPRSYRHKYAPGDFELDHFKLEDLLVTVYQPGGFRPFHVSIFSCDLPVLRKRWLFYDFLSANHVSGSYDDSLFTLHPRQSHGTTAATTTTAAVGDVDEGREGVYPWKRTSRFRIDGLRFDHLNRGYEGPLSWIVAGNLDIIADIHFPEDSADGIGKFMHDVMEKMEAGIKTRREKVEGLVRERDLSVESVTGIIGAAVGLNGNEEEGRLMANVVGLEDESYPTGMAKEEVIEAVNTSRDENNAITTTTTTTNTNTAAVTTGSESLSKSTSLSSNDRKFMMIDLHLEMNDTRAAIPLFTQDLSYSNNALMRPIIAYINSQRTIIPINCRMVKRVKEFDGSWTLFDSGLMDDLSAEVYDAFVKDIADADIKKRRIRAVGLWSLQVFMNAFLAAMAGTMIA
ncbi:Mitochondrial distribution and morphology protein 31, mitochondrial precursor [Orbilia oligospora]|uniref:Mitochondrial distribution and morphology protein 31, mitochondrial n=1 Tax=Orbilia oligospora TaxID=2813651 RepID=A0A7C8J1T2_ORBOL|nr:Mitochondrial distribution and morphology protein 31, mitochondrial precursor [Orbilia oligospora]KAF3103768.1 Mitochondrial distribution and morphology protein 31, mitochondrial precursor [Orbilia oligospora]KAF3110345.1 Mitochondrial distribution and morphology protein 31, mitochondrial precursor [Orbilia oligospora]KAF3124556.1 Mitochondrial distribution and morphology protein 31, mitochondrial precursor [Orbilia oligospora]